MINKMGSMWNLAIFLGTILVYSVFLSDAASLNRLNESSSDIEILNVLRSKRLSKGVDPEFERELLMNIIIPSYIRDFVELIKTKQLDPNELLKGVSNDDCKGHAMEWLWRVEHEFNTLGSKDNAWVLQMLDSWGKLPEGILTGHVNSFGDFDECLQIKVRDLDVRNPVYKDISKEFDGRYCTVYMMDCNTAMKTTPDPIDCKNSLTEKVIEQEVLGAVSLEELLKLLQFPEGIIIALSAGTCMPTTCRRNDVQKILVNAFEILYSDSKREPNTVLWPSTLACYEEKPEDFDAADYSVIVLLGVLVALCLSAGVLDYWLNHGVDKPPRRGAAYQYFMAFSWYTNITKLLSTRKNADDFGCLHGIRVFSTCWVILGHTYYAGAFLPQWNMIEVKTMYEDWSVMAVFNTSFAVDTFFVISGMLVTYNLYKVLDISKGKINIPMLYIHRYLRLTPAYAILIAIVATLLPFLGHGPYWDVMTRWGHVCEDSWWKNLLYVNNLVNTSWLVFENNPCKGEAWYLANDMQFYIVSPFIIYPMWRWELTGLLLLGIYTILSCISPALLVHFLDTEPALLPTRSPGTGKFFTHIYIRPYVRIQTFLVGVWLGWLLYKTKGKKVKLPALVVIGFWCLSTAICLSVIYSIQPWNDPSNEIPKVAGLAYAGLSRFGWGLAISWVIFACMKGYAGLINVFLSWSVFMPLGRLCYCVYLVSLHLQMIFHLRFTQPLRYDKYTNVNAFFSHIVMSFLVGFVFTLLFESPFMIIQKRIFPEISGPPTPPNNEAVGLQSGHRNDTGFSNADSATNAQVTEPPEKKVNQD